MRTVPSNRFSTKSPHESQSERTLLGGTSYTSPKFPATIEGLGELVPPAEVKDHEMIKAVSPAALLAGRGLWILTWKSQLRWRRFPMLVLMLGFLPILAYLTVSEGRSEVFFRWAVDFGRNFNWLPKASSYDPRDPYHFC